MGVHVNPALKPHTHTFTHTNQVSILGKKKKKRSPMRKAEAFQDYSSSEHAHFIRSY